MLTGAYRVDLVERWSGGDEALMIALHARRSAPSIQAWHQAHPQRPLLLALTGTDLYRDIDVDAAAQRSLQQAQALLVLNSEGPARLPPALRRRCTVLLQSCRVRRPLPRPTRHLRALMVGHLRDEKDPLTYLRAAQRLAGRADIRLDHVGAALDPALGAAAAALSARQPNYRWLGALPHAEVRRRLAAASVLVHCSRMEGGANVIVEALRSGTPVLASDIPGNRGLLGRDYGGCFAVGDDAALAARLQQARDDGAMLADLTLQCAARAPLFAPEAEAATLHRVLARLLSRPLPLEPDPHEP